MTVALELLLLHWSELSQAVFVPQVASEYERLVALPDDLMDEVGNDESHPLASLMEVIGTLIERYEDEHLPAFEASPQPRNSGVPCGPADGNQYGLASHQPRQYGLASHQPRQGL